VALFRAEVIITHITRIQRFKPLPWFNFVHLQDGTTQWLDLAQKLL